MVHTGLPMIMLILNMTAWRNTPFVRSFGRSVGLFTLPVSLFIYRARKFTQTKTPNFSPRKKKTHTHSSSFSISRLVWCTPIQVGLSVVSVLAQLQRSKLMATFKLFVHFCLAHRCSKNIALCALSSIINSVCTQNIYRLCQLNCRDAVTTAVHLEF